MRRLGQCTRVQYALTCRVVVDAAAHASVNFFFFLSLIRSETERKKKQGPNWSDSVQKGLKEINKMKTMHSPVSRWPVASTGSNKQMKKNKRVEEEETEEVYGVRYFVEYVVENGD